MRGWARGAYHWINLAAIWFAVRRGRWPKRNRLRDDPSLALTATAAVPKCGHDPSPKPRRMPDRVAAAHSRSPLIHHYWLRTLASRGLRIEAVPPEGLRSSCCTRGHGFVVSMCPFRTRSARWRCSAPDQRAARPSATPCGTRGANCARPTRHRGLRRQSRRLRAGLDALGSVVLGAGLSSRAWCWGLVERGLRGCISPTGPTSAPGFSLTSFVQVHPAAWESIGGVGRGGGGGGGGWVGGRGGWGGGGVGVGGANFCARGFCSTPPRSVMHGQPTLDARGSSRLPPTPGRRSLLMFPRRPACLLARKATLSNNNNSFFLLPPPSSPFCGAISDPTHLPLCLSPPSPSGPAHAHPSLATQRSRLRSQKQRRLQRHIDEIGGDTCVAGSRSPRGRARADVQCDRGVLTKARRVGSKGRRYSPMRWMNLGTEELVRREPGPLVGPVGEMQTRAIPRSTSPTPPRATILPAPSTNVPHAVPRPARRRELSTKALDVGVCSQAQFARGEDKGPRTTQGVGGSVRACALVRCDRQRQRAPPCADGQLAPTKPWPSRCSTNAAKPPADRLDAVSRPRCRAGGAAIMMDEAASAMRGRHPIRHAARLWRWLSWPSHFGQAASLSL